VGAAVTTLPPYFLGLRDAFALIILVIAGGFLGAQGPWLARYTWAFATDGYKRREKTLRGLTESVATLASVLENFRPMPAAAPAALHQPSEPRVRPPAIQALLALRVSGRILLDRCPATRFDDSAVSGLRTDLVTWVSHVVDALEEWPEFQRLFQSRPKADTLWLGMSERMKALNDVLAYLDPSTVEHPADPF
jgi:hypothetical protein